MADRQGGAPLFDADAIMRKAYFGVWLLSLLFAALAVWGLVRYPHWIWAASIGPLLVRLPPTTGSAVLAVVAKPSCSVWGPSCSSWVRVFCSASPSAWADLDGRSRRLQLLPITKSA
ncbi:hypothetical protein OG439_32825 [Amycolatopsis sp. NBC_01307]|uniref:hypothetical protein n=1 Tax=Amycolatopsis sp. NBC_01307 TaxID=2903561 RepID=UPI002E14E8B9|nr:hypothetical protein OG439_32825 [Amycolatopsis sp. NBC_01307]